MYQFKINKGPSVAWKTNEKRYGKWNKPKTIWKATKVHKINKMGQCENSWRTTGLEGHHVNLCLACDWILIFFVGREMKHTSKPILGRVSTWESVKRKTPSVGNKGLKDHRFAFSLCTAVLPSKSMLLNSNMPAGDGLQNVCYQFEMMYRNWEESFRNYTATERCNFMTVESTDNKVGITCCVFLFDFFLLIHFYCILQRYWSMADWEK